MPRILAVWHDKGVPPKQHLSEPRPGAVSAVEKRAHADRCQRLPKGLPEGMDLMVEVRLLTFFPPFLPRPWPRLPIRS